MNKLQKQIKRERIKAYLFFIAIGSLIIFLFIKPIVSDIFQSYNQDKETITNKEMQEFEEWKKKEEKREWENKSISN